MPYVIRDDTEYRRKDGSTYNGKSYFKGVTMGLFNEFVSEPEKAKQFRTKALAEINIRNRFGRGRNMVAVRIQ